MANESNLIPFSKKSKKEAREAGRKGGKASGIARRRKKDMRELMKLMLNEEIDGKDMTYAERLTKSMLTIAANPKQGASAVRAYETIIHIIGQDEPLQDKGALKAVEELLSGVDSVIDKDAE